MYVFLLFVLVSYGNIVQLTDGRVVVAVKIKSYANPNGTSFYNDTSSVRKCCDGPQRLACQSGDTCDTYFDICIGRMIASVGCQGAFMQTLVMKNSNFLNNVPLMKAIADQWNVSGQSFFVFVRDDDSNGTRKLHDHIDTLVQAINVKPAYTELEGNWQRISFDQTNVIMNVDIRMWCDDGYYSADCSVVCQQIYPISQCDKDSGNLSCNYDDELLLQFDLLDVKDYPMVQSGIQRYISEAFCPDPTLATVEEIQFNLPSQSSSFIASCDNGTTMIQPLEFESLVQTSTDDMLKTYFLLPVVRKFEKPKDYGQHFRPNMFVSVEIINFENPTGKSFTGEVQSGNRRCCDEPQVFNCDVVKDLCDVFFSICIGTMVNGSCTGTFLESSTFSNTSNLYTCGAVLLDFTTAQSFPSHPMIGAIYLPTPTTTIYVTVKDNDLNGQAFDVIDAINNTVQITPTQNVSTVGGVEVTLKHYINMKVKIYTWCASGYYGQNCAMSNYSSKCLPGWNGDNCDISDMCASNHCPQNATCVDKKSGFECVCPTGYNGSMCNDDIDECQFGICENNGTCTNTPGSYSCVCVKGWHGVICTEHPDYCQGAPCIHGTCNQVTKNYTCNCYQGWTGRNCSQAVNLCNTTANNCVHGECVNKVDGISCNCYPGITGQTCNLDIDECMFTPCLNNATCRNTLGSFHCTCERGFVGGHCQKNVDDCAGSPCQHSGTCVDGIANYSCQCVTGYTGKNCETNINDCAPNICHNGGICTDLLNAYSCACARGYTGRNCETLIPLCFNNTCSGRGKCTQTGPSFSCSCETGWQGNTCTDDIDECDSIPTPCNHLGICHNIPGSYNCECPSEWTGLNCDTDVNECQSPLCNNGGTCKNFPGGFLCHCTDQWSGVLCEVKFGAASAGSTVLQLQFNGTLISSKQGQLATKLYKFVSKKICFTPTVSLRITSISVGPISTVSFVSKCSGTKDVTFTQLNQTVSQLTSDDKAGFFAMPLVGVNQRQTALPASKSWITTDSHWAVLLGVFLVTLIVVIIFVVTCRKRRQKDHGRVGYYRHDSNDAPAETFVNPMYAESTTIVTTTTESES